MKERAAFVDTMSSLAIFRGSRMPLEPLQNGCPPKFLQLASFNGVSRCLIEATFDVAFNEPCRAGERFLDFF
jgi:hypothetical protein